jgi:flagellar basal-body rod modification protein FlgD
MTTSVGGTNNSTLPATSKKNDPLDPYAQKEMFLKLLVAQLKNQDPTNPMDQKEMMGQMAQFSTVEQLTNMAKSLETMQANATFSQSVSLIGKTVDYLDANGTLVADAQVTGVTTTGGKIQLVLGDGTKIAPADVVQVKEQ